MKLFLQILSIFALTFLLSCKEEPLSPLAETVASFSISNLSPRVGEAIQFENKSQHASSFLWEFGDGQVSYQTSPEHTYDSPGTFRVSLTASGESRDHTFLQTITVQEMDPMASFEIGKDSAEMGEEITFTNTSTHAGSYYWDFGDGNFSEEENPVHFFTRDSTYTITLIASRGLLHDTTTQTLTIYTNFDGSWRASTIESDAQISSASMAFRVEGREVSLSSWSANASFGYLFGYGFGSTRQLNENNAFGWSINNGSLSVSFSIRLTSSTTGTGTFRFNGQPYQMEVTRQ